MRRPFENVIFQNSKLPRIRKEKTVQIIIVYARKPFLNFRSIFRRLNAFILKSIYIFDSESKTTERE